MNIGYTKNRENVLLLKKVCHEVTCINSETNNVIEFFDFIKSNLSNNIYVLDLYDLEIQIIQLLPVLQFLLDNNKIIHFINKNVLEEISDDKYFHHLLWISKTEKDIMTKRTIRGIKNSMEKGVKSGRPMIPRNQIEKIQYLATVELRSVREIAGICKVSVGTAHKYIKKLSVETV